jgi:hypothetical protein
MCLIECLYADMLHAYMLIVNWYMLIVNCYMLKYITTYMIISLL